MNNERTVDTGRKVQTGIKGAAAVLVAFAALGGSVRLPVSASTDTVTAASGTCPDIVTRQYIGFTKKSFQFPYGVKYSKTVTDDCTGNVLSTGTSGFPTR